MKVANKYKDYMFDETKAYDKNGKLYVLGTAKCDRCVKGVYVCRVENGQPVPHPAYDGVCLKCGGTGYITKEFRLYTDKEFNQMEQANEKAAEKKKASLEAKMKAEYAQKKAEWLEKEGFTADGHTWIYKEADSYNRREELKSLGFKFNYSLLWHIANLPEGFADHCIEVEIAAVATFSAWGTATYNSDAINFVKQLIDKENPHPASSSIWIGQVGEKIENIEVTCTNKKTVDGMYGVSTLYTFEDEDGNVINWWTTSTKVDTEVGDTRYMKATIKKLGEFHGVKSTTVTRAKLTIDIV